MTKPIFSGLFGKRLTYVATQKLDLPSNNDEPAAVIQEKMTHEQREFSV